MNSQIHIFLFCLLTGSSCAVFYTKGKDTDYPRIGRRSFYTSGEGNHYPRIGRRSSIAAAAFPGSSSAFPELDKRGIFTEGSYGTYPRVGRRSGPPSATASAFAAMDDNDLIATARRSQLLDRLLNLKDELQTSDAAAVGSASSSSMDQANGHDISESTSMVYPLDIMFIAFDLDTDGSLTKEEFISGLQKYRQENPLC